MWSGIFVIIRLPNGLPDDANKSQKIQYALLPKSPTDHKTVLIDFMVSHKAQKIYDMDFIMQFPLWNSQWQLACQLMKKCNVSLQRADQQSLEVQFLNRNQLSNLSNRHQAVSTNTRPIAFLSKEAGHFLEKA